MTNSHCQALRADGQPCRAFHGKTSDFCLLHDPNRREAAKAGRKRGGRKHGAQLRAAAAVARAAEGAELWGDLQELDPLGELCELDTSDLQTLDSLDVQTLDFPVQEFDPSDLAELAGWRA